MTLSSGFTLFTALLILALIPGPAVVAVTAQAMSRGFKPAAMMSLGIVAGDFVFVCLSLLGLLALAQLMGELFVIIKYLGAVWLFWMALSLWRNTNSMTPQESSPAANGSGFLTGLFITLGNPKAIMFYVGFFPAFLNLQHVSLTEVLIILSITFFAVGGVNLGYALMASKLGQVYKNRAWQRYFNRGAAALLTGSGIAILYRD